MRKPLLRCLAPLAIVALCAAAPASQSTLAQQDIGGLDLAVPVATGSWSVSLRSLSGPSGTMYALDSTGSAITARFFPGALGLNRQAPTSVSLTPQTLASIQKAIAAANATNWVDEPSLPGAAVPRMLGMDSLPDHVTSSPHNHITLTLAWRAANGTILHGQAAWSGTASNGEPTDAVSLARTLGSAFGLLI
jgi:hypothetical protein